MKLAGRTSKPFTIQGCCWISLMDALFHESRINILEIKFLHSVPNQLECELCQAIKFGDLPGDSHDGYSTWHSNIFSRRADMSCASNGTFPQTKMYSTIPRHQTSTSG